MSWIREELDAYAALARAMADDPRLTQALERICALVVECLDMGGKILTLGNGGSAADAVHLSEELIGRYRDDRPPLAAVSLVADAPALTCIANDYGFERIFERQVEALCRPGDVIVAFSTSGNSENVVLALEAARACGGRTVGLLGRDGGKCLALCDAALVVPSSHTARIQEVHGLALHVICEAAERRFGKDEG
jgi:D-sedoheptulose 7-phosphate isomerase